MQLKDGISEGEARHRTTRISGGRGVGRDLPRHHRLMADLEV